MTMPQMFRFHVLRRREVVVGHGDFSIRGQENSAVSHGLPPHAIGDCAHKRARLLSGPALRHLVLQVSVVATALCLEQAPAEAACVTDGNTVTCTGSSGPLTIPPPPGPDVIVNIFDNFNGGITVTGMADTLITNSGNLNGNINVTGGTDFTFVQNG
jgi:hypothetical protein